MTEYFDKKFDKLPTRDYMEGRMNSIEQNVSSNSARIEGIEETLRGLTREEGGKHTQSYSAACQATKRDYRERDELREEKFRLAKRSLRVWPIRGESSHDMSTALDEFLKGGLKMKQEDLDTVIIESIERTRSSPRAKHHHEVLVTFRDEDTRRNACRRK